MSEFSDDPFAPARGVVFGCLLGAAMWVFAFALWTVLL